MGNLVAIVGAPNVGKSTLFNRLVGKRKAIVDNQPGVTRDRNYEEVVWDGRRVVLVDTGGFEWDQGTPFKKRLREQIELALEEADLIVFVADGRQGLTPTDQQVVGRLRKTLKPVLYTVNKIDNPKMEEGIGEYYRLGVEEILPVSALHGSGLEDLKERILTLLPEAEEQAAEGERIQLAVIGRPNVGKSSLVNALLGYERVMVSAEPGTTRDAIDTPFEHRGQKYRLIDTAGIRRKGRIALQLEKFAVVEALKSLDRSDLAIVLIDSQDGVTDQDARIAGLAFEKGKGCIIAVNKWDRMQKPVKDKKAFLEEVRYQLKYLAFAPILPISAKTGYGLEKLLSTIREMYRQYTRRVGTGPLNQALEKILDGHPPPLFRGKRLKIYYGTQTEIKPPTFVLFTNYPEGIHFSYERYLINRIREDFRFDKIPIRIIFRKRERKGRTQGVKPRGA